MDTNPEHCNIRVLFVEDDAICRGTVEGILRLNKIAVTTAVDAESGIELLEQRPFDVIISDIRLPGSDGLTFLHNVKASHPDIPVILVTGHSSLSTAIDAVKAGATDYILKPLGDAAQLVSSIKKAAATHQLVRLNRDLQEKVSEASERERRALGRDLHDVLSQNLAGIEMLTSVIEKKLDNDNGLKADITMIRQLAKDSTAFCRRLASGLFPVDLDKQGLRAALEELTITCRKIFNVNSTFRADQGLNVTDRSASLHILRIAQEALTNAAKHSGASEVTINLNKTEDGRIKLTVTDNGSWRDASNGNGAGLGLHLMRYRAGLIGAELDIRKQTNGTEVVCSWKQQ